MSLHRFFLPPECIVLLRVRFPPDQARQIRSVLRLRPGDTVIVLVGDGTDLLVRLDEVGSEVTGIVEERRANHADLHTAVTLYQGVLKGSRLEFVLQKGTELGLTGFAPMVTARTVAGEPGSAKQRRYETIVREAAEQSGRGSIPTLNPAMSFSDALRQASIAQVIVPWEEEVVHHLRDVTLDPARPTAIFIGPEGGFTVEEIAAARDAGAEVVTLGTRILRADTAAIVTATLVLAALGEMG